MKYGIDLKNYSKILTIIESNLEIDKAIVFGSRAINFNINSPQVEIAIFCKSGNNISLEDISKNLQENCNNKYFFNIISFNEIDSDDLRNHVINEGIVIFER